jgi:hypothetical protein
VTANDFRRLALALPETEERAHTSHPDFRVCGKIFATLGYPDKSRGMVKLSAEQQHSFSKDYPDAFVPVKGAWGRRGATSVNLKASQKETLRKAIEGAWRNTAPKRLAEQFQGKGQPGEAQTTILAAPPSRRLSGGRPARRAGSYSAK